MNITINGQNIPNENKMNMITFNHIPTILSVVGTKANNTLTYYKVVINGGKDNLDGSEYVKFGNSILTPTNNINEAVNSIFYLSNSSSSSSNNLMAYYLSKALNSTSESASYNIYSEGDCVYIYSKQYGHSLDNLETNINGFFTKEEHNSTLVNELDNSKIILNLFNDNNFITTLEKNAINSECKFDLSPILINNTEDGKFFNYNIKISQLTEIDNISIGNITNLYAINGYSVNQGKYYLNMLDISNNLVLLQNIYRGSEKETSNNTVLYCSEPNITLTLANIIDESGAKINVKYLDSVFNEITTEEFNFNQENKIIKCDIILNKINFDKSSYIDIDLPTNQTIRFNVIKPLKYANETNRIYWYNSYGGISFFDFTGTKTEERKTEKTTYKKSNLNLYDDKQLSLDKIYSNTLEYEVSLKTHMIEKDGIYPLYDLLNSYHAWIIINGEENEIIVTDLKINETQNTNIYQCEITYKYSSNDMF